MRWQRWDSGPASKGRPTMPDWNIRIQFVREIMISVTAEELQATYGRTDEDAAWAYYVEHRDEALLRPDEVFGEVFLQEINGPNAPG